MDESSRKFGTWSLAAAGRLGIDEIGLALRAFPESIQAFEPGTMFSRTSGEIADANRNNSLESRLQEGMERAESQPEPSKGMDRE